MENDKFNITASSFTEDEAVSSGQSDEDKAKQPETDCLKSDEANDMALKEDGPAETEKQDDAGGKAVNAAQPEAAALTEKEIRKRDRRAANQIVYSKSEEWINRISHLVGASLALVGSVLMIIKVCLSGLGALAIVSVCLYSFSLLMLYIMSTLYHWQPVGKRRRAVFRRFDHCSIALLIAGTYAPLMLIDMYSQSKVWAIVLASVVLGFAVLSCVFNAIDVNKFKVYCLISYVVMGWACVIRIDLLVANLPAFVLLIGGGVVYTLGIIFYRIKSIPYNHAIWHFFVLAGSILHFASIYFFVIP